MKNKNQIINNDNNRQVTLMPSPNKNKANLKYNRYVRAIEAELAASAHLETNIWIQKVLSGLTDDDLYTIAITKP